MATVVNPTRTSDRALLGVVAAGSFLTAMTSSIINVALPDIARDLGVDPARAGWFMLAFLLTVTVLLLAAGRLGDIVGHRRTYAAGFAVFALGSVGCALAPSAVGLDLARVLQGVGSAAVMASAPALITRAVGPTRRGYALGLMSTAIYVGLAIGPPAGGVVLEWIGWRPIFGLSAAAGVLVLVLTVILVRDDGAARQSRAFDLRGAVLIAGALVSFLLLCTRGPTWGLAYWGTWAAAAATAVLLPAFLLTEHRVAEPMLDLGLFRSRTFSLASAAALFNYVSLFIILFALPFALREGQGLAPPVIGRIVAAQALAMALLAWGSGTLSDRIGSRGLAVGGMLTLAAGNLGLAVNWPSASPWHLGAWLFVCGAGTGVFVSPNSSALMGAAPAGRQGIAGGVMALARNLGMALGVALAAGLFATVFAPGEPVTWSPAADGVVRLGFVAGAVAAAVAALVSWFGGAQPGRGHTNGSARDRTAT